MRRAAMLVVSLAVVACGGQSAGDGGEGGSGGGGSGGGAGTGGSGGSAPTYTCMDIVTCVNRCAGNDGVCTRACLDAGTAEAQDKVLALANCFVDNGCETPTDCLACSGELDDCVRDGLVPLDCPNLAFCFSVCESSQECREQVCLSRALPGAYEALQAYQACLTANGCVPSDTVCVTRFCSREKTDCYGG